MKDQSVIFFFRLTPLLRLWSSMCNDPIIFSIKWINGHLAWKLVISTLWYNSHNVIHQCIDQRCLLNFFSISSYKKNPIHISVSQPTYIISSDNMINKVLSFSHNISLKTSIIPNFWLVHTCTAWKQWNKHF